MGPELYREMMDKQAARREDKVLADLQQRADAGDARAAMRSNRVSAAVDMNNGQNRARAAGVGVNRISGAQGAMPGGPTQRPSALGTKIQNMKAQGRTKLRYALNQRAAQQAPAQAPPSRSVISPQGAPTSTPPASAARKPLITPGGAVPPPAGAGNASSVLQRVRAGVSNVANKATGAAKQVLAKNPEIARGAKAVVGGAAANKVRQMRAAANAPGVKEKLVAEAKDALKAGGRQAVNAGGALAAGAGATLVGEIRSGAIQKKALEAAEEAAKNRGSSNAGRLAGKGLVGLGLTAGGLAAGGLYMNNKRNKKTEAARRMPGNIMQRYQVPPQQQQSTDY